MKRIFLSIITIAALGLLSVGATGAFLSDAETSSGNTFAAGTLDLKVDNHSYYNGNECKNIGTPQAPNYQWVGSALFPVPGTPCTTSWDLTDLTVQKFFDFLDLKPGDTGEDTISLHVNNNDAYLCANVKLTSNNENGCNGPEGEVDGSCDNPGPAEGELASNVNFIMWADDGDNVLETTEPVLYEGPIGALGSGGQITIPLADSATNIWTGTGGPAPGGVTQYIGKAWCFGKVTQAPLPQDGLGTTSPRTPGNSTGGLTCAPVQADGVTPLGNETQGDSLTADISFDATQSRSNPGFRCTPPPDEPQAKLTVTKVVVNLPNSGNKVVGDFNLSVFDGFLSTPVISGVQVVLPAGNYSVNETGSQGYVASYSGTGCDAEGNVVLVSGDEKTCTITNTEQPALITLKKVVTGTNPLANPNAFKMRIDGVLVPNGTSKAVTANHAHTITEDASGTNNVPAGYSFAGITGDPQCPAVLGGTATLTEGQSITCTITNHKN